jgi:hypothetical protein
LYIDTDEDIDDLEAELNRLLVSVFEGLRIEAPLFRNENFEADKNEQAPYDFIESSQYYSEIGTIEEAPEQLPNFHSGVATLITRLRAGGRIVTASCDFEDFIASETGWNWTVDQPQPPE